MVDEQYIEIATKISNDMLNFKTKTKSFNEVYNICLNKYLDDATSNINNKILIMVIKIITKLGYDIDSVKPCRFKKY